MSWCSLTSTISASYAASNAKAGPASGAARVRQETRIEYTETKGTMSKLLQHTVEVTDNAQECSSDEKRLASNAKAIYALRAQWGSEIRGTVRRLCGAGQTGRWLVTEN
jgi:hypothetical protein